MANGLDGTYVYQHACRPSRAFLPPLVLPRFFGAATFHTLAAARLLLASPPSSPPLPPLASPLPAQSEDLRKICEP